VSGFKVDQAEGKISVSMATPEGTLTIPDAHPHDMLRFGILVLRAVGDALHHREYGAGRPQT
jgi:hypothetical protein